MAKAPTITKAKTTDQIEAQRLRINDKLNAAFEAKRSSVKAKVFNKKGKTSQAWAISRRVLREPYRKLTSRTRTVAKAALSAQNTSNQKASYIKAWATRLAKYGPSGSGKVAGKKK